MGPSCVTLKHLNPCCALHRDVQCWIGKHGKFVRQAACKLCCQADFIPLDFETIPRRSVAPTETALLWPGRGISEEAHGVVMCCPEAE